MNDGSRRAIQRFGPMTLKSLRSTRRDGQQIQADCARGIERSQAADAVAETFLVAWRRSDQIEDVETGPGLAFTGTVYRVVGDQRRSESRAWSLGERLRGLAVAEAETSDAVVAAGRDRPGASALTALVGGARPPLGRLGLF